MLTARTRTSVLRKAHGRRQASFSVHRQPGGCGGTTESACLYPGSGSPDGGGSRNRADWIAVDPWNTDNPHVRLILRGGEEGRRDVVIHREYISQRLEGDRTNAVLAAAGYNFGLLLRWLAELLRAFVM